MPSRSLDDLRPEFHAVCTTVLTETAARGVVMRPCETMRSPWEQAIYWRQSRATEQVQNALAQLNTDGAHFLAEVLQSVGPRNGRHVTNALPGRSAHQYGLALDCFWFKNGEAEWDDPTGYRVYAHVAQSHGLSAGAFWISFQDPPHIQDPSMDRIGRTPWQSVDAEMYRIWGNTPSGMWCRP